MDSPAFLDVFRGSKNRYQNNTQKVTKMVSKRDPKSKPKSPKWAPKTPPTWDPKGGQNQNLKIIDFACIYYTLATFKGAENRHCSMFFWNPNWGWLLEPISVILAHFWGPFWIPFLSLFVYHFCIDFQTPNNSEKWRGSSAEP